MESSPVAIGAPMSPPLPFPPPSPPASPSAVACPLSPPPPPSASVTARSPSLDNQPLHPTSAPTLISHSCGPLPGGHGHSPKPPFSPTHPTRPLRRAEAVPWFVVAGACEAPPHPSDRYDRYGPGSPPASSPAHHRRRRHLPLEATAWGAAGLLRAGSLDACGGTALSARIPPVPISTGSLHGTPTEAFTRSYTRTASGTCNSGQIHGNPAEISRGCSLGDCPSEGMPEDGTGDLYPRPSADPHRRRHHKSRLHRLSSEATFGTVPHKTAGTVPHCYSAPAHQVQPDARAWPAPEAASPAAAPGAPWEAPYGSTSGVPWEGPPRPFSSPKGTEVDCRIALGRVVEGGSGLWHAPGVPMGDGGEKAPWAVYQPHSDRAPSLAYTPYASLPLSSHSSHASHSSHSSRSSPHSCAQVVPIGGPQRQSSAPPEGMPTVHPREAIVELLLRSKSTSAPCFQAASRDAPHAASPGSDSPRSCLRHASQLHAGPEATSGVAHQHAKHVHFNSVVQVRKFWPAQG